MNIFVAKLSSSTTSEDLETLFSKYGEVISAQVIIDRITGHSKKFGFVEMKNEEEAVEAIQNLNDSDFDSSKIVVKKARPRNESNERPRSGGGNYRNRR
jgi:RNA recognition motif-containing protein